MIDVMWYDVSWPLDVEGWESAKMNAMVREPSIRILKRVGEWMRANGEAVYNSERIQTEWMPIGIFSYKGGTLYLHVYNWPGLRTGLFTS